jgi:hypothetical protein
VSLLPLARILIIIGVILLAAGILLYLAVKVGLPLFSLPGDFRIERENFTCVFALGTSILLSILLTIGLNILVRFLNR